MRSVLASILLTACASHEPPSVQVVGDDASIGVEVVELWGLGFSPTLDDTGLPECDRTWYSDTFEPTCQITIRIERVPNLTDDDCSNKCQINGRADQDSRLVEINGTLQFTSDQYRHIVMHEVGHILLDSMHLDSYGVVPWKPIGVMQAHPTDYPTTPSENDLALACFTVGICLDPPLASTRSGITR